MNRQSPEESREAHIAKLTETLFQARLSALGNPAVLREVTKSVFDHLGNMRHVEDQYRLTLGEITFAELRDQVMRAEAEVDAVKAVERMEKSGAEDAKQAEVERRIWERELSAAA